MSALLMDFVLKGDDKVVLLWQQERRRSETSNSEFGCEKEEGGASGRTCRSPFIERETQKFAALVTSVTLPLDIQVVCAADLNVSSPGL